MQRNQRSNCQHPLDVEKAREFQKKHLLLPFLTMPKPLTVWITTLWNIIQEIEIPDHLMCIMRNP